MLDQNLTFDDHIEYLHGKAVNKLGILRKSRNFLDQNTSVLLYKSLVLPQFDYCDIVYDCTSLGNLQKLQKLQNSACRTMLLADNRTSVAEMHDDLQLLTLNQRRELHLSVDCHKHVNIPDSSLNYMFKSKRKRTTRSGPKLVEVPQRRTATGRKAFSFRGPNHWNNLDVSKRVIENQDSFKRTILKEMLRDVDHPT